MPQDQVRVSQDGVFYTLQGEGPFVGVPSVFVRLDTCNLRCKWDNTICDAHYTSWHPGGLREDREPFVARVKKEMIDRNCRHLVITGGEPVLQEEAVQSLTRMVIESRFHIFGKPHSTIETNGTRFISCGADLICLSPKLKSSTPVGTKYEKMHERARWNPEAIKQFMKHYHYYFKFVIDRDSDVTEVLEMLAEVGQPLPDPDHVVFMPQGIDTQELLERGKWIAEWCKQLGVRFTPRLQIELWGNKPGT